MEKVSAILLIPAAILCIYAVPAALGDTELITSFEEPAALQQWSIQGHGQLTDAWATEGRASLYLRFEGGYGLLEGRGGMPGDWSGWEMIKVDCWNPGPPYSLTMRADNDDGRTSSSWYHPLRTGFTTLEFIIPGFAERIDISDVARCHLRVDPPVEGGRDLELYIDNIRFCRSEPREVYQPKLPEIAHLAPKIAGNFLQNGDFELGLQGWGSWGMWDGGEYRFGTATGDGVYSGNYAAAIYCQKQGRGGIFSKPFTLPEAGIYTLSFHVKAEQPGSIGYGFESPGWEDVYWAEATRQWQHITHRFERQADFTGAVYIYSRCPDTVYIDELSFTGPGEPASAVTAEGPATVMTIEGDKTFVNDEPFFPIGIYRAAPEHLDGTGFNCIPGWDRVDAASLDACRAAGLYMLPDLSGLMRGHLPQQAALAIAQMQNHPAVMAWYLCDEPDHEKWNVPPAEMELGTRVIHESDPNHPTVTVVMPWAESIFYRYKDCTDIIATDIYPLGGGGSPLEVANKLDILRRATANNKPIWAVIESTAKATVTQEYAVTYLAITHGADGILYWEYQGVANTPMWASMLGIASELELLTPVLCAPDAAEQCQSSSNLIHHLLKDALDGRYLICVNGSDRPMTGVRLEIPQATAGEVEVLFEGRNLRLRNGAIEDDFAAWERHVYAWPG